MINRWVTLACMLGNFLGTQSVVFAQSKDTCRFPLIIDIGNEIVNMTERIQTIPYYSYVFKGKVSRLDILECASVLQLVSIYGCQKGPVESGQFAQIKMVFSLSMGANSPNALTQSAHYFEGQAEFVNNTMPVATWARARSGLFTQLKPKRKPPSARLNRNSVNRNIKIVQKTPQDPNGFWLQLVEKEGKNSAFYSLGEAQLLLSATGGAAALGESHTFLLKDPAQVCQ